MVIIPQFIYLHIIKDADTFYNSGVGKKSQQNLTPPPSDSLVIFAPKQLK